MEWPGGRKASEKVPKRIEGQLKMLKGIGLLKGCKVFVDVAVAVLRGKVWIPFWRPGQRYRPVFLHVNLEQLAIDAEVLEKDPSDGKLAPFSLLCTLTLGSNEVQMLPK